MGLAHDTATGDGRELARILGDYRTGRPGPTVVVLGGVHGNEPAGTVAARHVLAELEARRPPACGRLVAVTGNRAALARGQRFVDRDLNRRWFEHGVAALRRRDPAADGVEDREQRELVEVIDRIVSESDRPVVFVDLHSASSQGPPFACMADTLDNRRIALALPLPVILGLEEVIDGSLLGYLSDLGHCGVAVEGGPHAGKETVTRHVAAIWLVLVATGLLAEDALEELPAQRARLRQASRALPRFLEVRHRHAVAPGDGFVMEPGHVSFQPVAARQVVATDSHGPVVVPESGRILLPRYQGQGEDGFFFARAVKGSAAIW